MKFPKYLLSIVALAATSCAKNNTPSGTSASPTSATSQISTISSASSISTSEIKPSSPRFKEGFNFNYFQNQGTEVTHQIRDGLTHYEHTMTKKNGDKTVINTLEIDLNKVNIVAGTKNNKSYDHTFPNNLEVPYKMGQAYEQDTGKEVLASINADFFNPDPASGKCVNAFVKDGFIVKNSHNDNSGYDYQVSSHDVPASYPMLFGVIGNEAKVSPIFKDNNLDPKVVDNKREYVKTKLTYSVVNNDSSFTLDGAKSKFSTGTTTVRPNDLYYLLDISGGAHNMKVLSYGRATARGDLPALEVNQAYLVFDYADSKASKFANKILATSTLELEVNTSVDDTWKGADTILGCRQNIIKNGEIAETLAFENSNGVSNTIVPRSSVGVREDGIVVIYAVEGLSYGGKGTSSDPKGVSIYELAEYMSYNNILNGANFDGGGSTQLIVKDPVKGSQVYVRSSDTGSTSLTSTRKVSNALLVTTK